MTLVGVPNDVLTFWIRRGLVRPLEAPDGSKRNLRFAYWEANFAALALALREYGLDIDAMLSIASIYRRAIEWAKKYDLSFDNVGAISRLWQAVFEYTSSVVYEPVDDNRLRQIIEDLRPGIRGMYTLDDRLIDIVAKTAPEGGLELSRAFAEIAAQPLSLGENYQSYLWKNSEGWQHSLHRYQAIGQGVYVKLSINVLSIFYHVWTRT